jgi:hypothetical protein
MRLENTKIVKGAIHRDSIQVEDRWTETRSLIGNIIQCWVQFTRGTEKYLAIHLTDMHKRGILDLALLSKEIGELLEKSPTIDGTNTPCLHEEWHEFQGVSICTNCGHHKEQDSDGH